MAPLSIVGEPSMAENRQPLTNRYEALLHTSHAINAHREPASLFRALASELRQAVTFDFIGLFLYDELLNRIEMPVLEVVNGVGLTLPAVLKLLLPITTQRRPAIVRPR